MPLPHLIAIPCRLAPGMFSTERLFTVALADGGTHRGIAPRHFCWNAAGIPLADREPAQEADGLVAARIVEQIDETQIAVEVPDGEVLAVDRSAVRPRPTEVRPPNVPVLMEPQRDVPV